MGEGTYDQKLRVVLKRKTTSIVKQKLLSHPAPRPFHCERLTHRATEQPSVTEVIVGKETHSRVIVETLLLSHIGPIPRPDGGPHQPSDPWVPYINFSRSTTATYFEHFSAAEKCAVARGGTPPPPS